MWVSCRFFSEVFLGSYCCCSRIPLYVVDCVKVCSFTPWILKSLGTSRFRGSGSCLFVPCFARALLPSLPRFPSCPFTHCMDVFMDLCLIRWAAFLNSFAFCMLIHPSFSQVSRWVVRPLIMYFESLHILTGWYRGITSSAAMTAAILLIWLDWASLLRLQRALIVRLVLRVNWW